MRAYLIRRFLLIVPTLFIVTLVIFFSVRFIPGSIIDLMTSEMAYAGGAAKVNTELIRHSLGLDVPVYIQYGKWLWEVLQGNLGNYRHHISFAHSSPHRYIFGYTTG